MSFFLVKKNISLWIIGTQPQVSLNIDRNLIHHQEKDSAKTYSVSERNSSRKQIGSK